MRREDADFNKAANIDAVVVQENQTVLLPFEVLAETLNIIGKKFGKAAAVTAGHALLARDANGDIGLIPSEVSTIERALELQITASGGPSYIDCLVMAHACEQQTTYIFGFDATFQKNGYKLPGL